MKKAFELDTIADHCILQRTPDYRVSRYWYDYFRVICQVYLIDYAAAAAVSQMLWEIGLAGRGSRRYTEAARLKSVC